MFSLLLSYYYTPYAIFPGFVSGILAGKYDRTAKYFEDVIPEKEIKQLKIAQSKQKKLLNKQEEEK